MNRETELQLIKACADLKTHKTTSLSESESTSDTVRYRCTKRFTQEVEKLHKATPIPIAHHSEMKETHSFVVRETPLGNLLVSRDKEGRVHVFHNMCRHRGAVLVTEKCGASKRFTCPYHSWSYTTDGALASVPGQNHCFPNLDKDQRGLLEIPSIEKYGFIWACPRATDNVGVYLDDYLGDVSEALKWLQSEKLTLFKRHSKVWNANWKLLAEGGIETYHFSYAHRDTIGPSFMNNTAVIDALGDHLRVVMPTKVLPEVSSKPLEQQHIRECTHVLYMLFPSTVLLVQHNHIDWIHFRPLAVDKTEINIATLVPVDQIETRQEHWQRNHKITLQVLDEDFVLGEGIQSSMSNGAMEQIHYGRNEWALQHLNDLIDRILVN